MNLYEIKGDYEIILEQAFAEAEENDGVISDELSFALDEICQTYEDKIISCGLMYKNFIANAEAIKTEKIKLEKRQKIELKKAEWLEKYITSSVPQGYKLNNPKITIGFRKSKQVIIPDESLVPDKYCKIERKPIKSDIKKLITSGCCDFAQIIEKENIQIK